MADRTCSVDGCERPHLARGLCAVHYSRTRKTGRTGSAEVRVRDSGRTCSVDGCERPYRAGGLCTAHYKRRARTGGTGSAEIRRRDVDGPPGVLAPLPYWGGGRG